jgi:hypothetical protein
MDFVIIELLLWAGLIFFFWVLKDNLGRMESDIDTIELFNQHKIAASSRNMPYARPDKVIDPIGSYQDAQIYRYAIINGKNYQFDHVFPSGKPALLQERQRCLAPGLVYTECPDPDVETGRNSEN